MKSTYFQVLEALQAAPNKVYNEKVKVTALLSFCACLHFDFSNNKQLLYRLSCDFYSFWIQVVGLSLHTHLVFFFTD